MVKSRSRIHLLNVVLILSLSIIIGFASTLWGASAEEERVAKLVEGAKKEGKFTWYTQMAVPESAALLKKFEEKYPFVKGEFLKLSVNPLINKVMEEHRAGANKVDIIYISGFGISALKKANLLQKYVSPESLVFPQGARDPEGYGTSGHMMPKVIVYNTKLLAPNEAPKSYEDLLAPKWKGTKFAIDNSNYEWFANVLKIMGKEKAIELMKGLSKQRPQVRRGNSLRSLLVSAGEFYGAVPVNMDGVESMKAVGAPLEWVGAEPVVTLTHMAALAAKANHPNSSKLFIDFILSKEGQEILKNAGNIPVRPDVLPPRISKGLKNLYFSDTRLADVGYSEIIREYDDIFIRKTWQGEKW